MRKRVGVLCAVPAASVGQWPSWAGAAHCELPAWALVSGAEGTSGS